MVDPEFGELSNEELDRRIAEHQARCNEIPVIDAEEFAAAQRDPKVIEFLEEAREEAEKWEKTDWGYQLKAEYRPEADSSSLLRRGATLVGNIGKIAFRGQMGELLSKALGRPF